MVPAHITSKDSSLWRNPHDFEKRMQHKGSGWRGIALSSREASPYLSTFWSHTWHFSVLFLRQLILPVEQKIVANKATIPFPSLSGNRQRSRNLHVNQLWFRPEKFDRTSPYCEPCGDARHLLPMLLIRRMVRPPVCGSITTTVR
jgi:hypothetical protein